MDSQLKKVENNISAREIRLLRKRKIIITIFWILCALFGLIAYFVLFILPELMFDKQPLN